VKERPKKALGQHFLERAWVEKVVPAIAPRRDEVFIEVGPGGGALTRPLAAAAAHVVACEIDRELAAELARHAPPTLTVLAADFLALTPGDLLAPLTAAGVSGNTLRVAGNLPYNAASAILIRLGELRDGGLPLVDATVMVQREVADRLLAEPGGRDYGALTVRVRHTAAVNRLLNLPRGAFRPAPKVESTLVRLTWHDARPLVLDARTFHGMTRAIFTRRRKTLANALLAFRRTAPAPGEALARARIDGRRRPETLDLDELVRLADVYAAADRARSGP
jgi:16S rRNA (adenine1518-N6/adenine1519-N6)-dimethyltransferase